MRQWIDLVEEAQIPNDRVFDYMNGLCTVLAYAIHKRFGFPIFTDEEQSHAVCRLPDGKVLDAEGISEGWWFDEEFIDVERLTNGIPDDMMAQAHRDVEEYLEPLLRERGYL